MENIKKIAPIVEERLELLRNCKEENAVFFEYFKFYSVGYKKLSTKLEGIAVVVDTVDVIVEGYTLDGFGGLTLEIGEGVKLGAEDAELLGKTINILNRCRASLESYFKADFALRHELNIVMYLE